MCPRSGQAGSRRVHAVRERALRRTMKGGASTLTGRSGDPMMTYALWTVQGMLAALFLFAGGMKLVMPIEAMTAQMPEIPGAFLRFIGVAETLGALGLILPGLLRIRPGLTPLAAAGLVIILLGAT